MAVTSHHYALPDLHVCPACLGVGLKTANEMVRDNNFDPLCALCGGAGHVIMPPPVLADSEWIADE